MREAHLNVKLRDFRFALFPESLVLFRSVETRECKRRLRFTMWLGQVSLVAAHTPPTAAEKTIDFVFVGGLQTDNCTKMARQWVLAFVENRFTNSSFLDFTDKRTRELRCAYTRISTSEAGDNWTPMGPFDYTGEREGFVPKQHKYDESTGYGQGTPAPGPKSTIL